MSSRRRSARRVRRQPGRPVWLFDLDNTLHHASHAIFPRMNVAMTDFIERELRLPRAEADALRSAYTQRYGAVLVGLMRRHDIDAAAFLEEVHRFDALPSLVRFERGVRQALLRLPGRKILFTNGPEDYALAVLEVIGIGDVFERVIALEHMRDRRGWRSKPDHGMLRRTLRQLHATHRETVLVEDTRSHLKHYKRTGLKTVWMVGHLRSVRPSMLGGPARPVDATGGHAQRRGESGRPHYIDRRIRSIKSL
ncbi:Pyrimidine 5'-nucleotidase [Pararobbsia alpina]|uniref:pyrimidine 5'-nucleotidase n=1 Tax=Pararobbsia alpina TaxID=621374 RepID=UPI0039A5181F